MFVGNIFLIYLFGCSNIFFALVETACKTEEVLFSKGLVEKPTHDLIFKKHISNAEELFYRKQRKVNVNTECSIY